MGNANGRYLAHLHFEIRGYPSLAVGSGYYLTELGRLPAEVSIKEWRNRANDHLSSAPVGEPLPAKSLQVEQKILTP